MHLWKNSFSHLISGIVSTSYIFRRISYIKRILHVIPLFACFRKRLAISEIHFVVSCTLERSKWAEAWHGALRRVFGISVVLHHHACLVLLPQLPLLLHAPTLQGPNACLCEPFSLPFAVCNGVDTCYHQTLSRSTHVVSPLCVCQH